jgi:hypothetical protein
VYDYSKIDSHATRYKALKSKRIFRDGVTGVTHFPSSFAQPPSFYHLTALSCCFQISAPHSLCNTTTYLLLLSHLLRRHLTLLRRGLSSREIVDTLQLLGSPGFNPCLGTPSVSHVLARGVALIPRPISFYVFHFAGGYPNLSIWRLQFYHTYCYPCWLRRTEGGTLFLWELGTWIWLGYSGHCKNLASAINLFPLSLLALYWFKCETRLCFFFLALASSALLNPGFVIL